MNEWMEQYHHLHQHHRLFCTLFIHAFQSIAVWLADWLAGILSMWENSTCSFCHFGLGCLLFTAIKFRPIFFPRDPTIQHYAPRIDVALAHGKSAAIIPAFRSCISVGNSTFRLEFGMFDSWLCSIEELWIAALNWKCFSAHLHCIVYGMEEKNIAWTMMLYVLCFWSLTGDRLKLQHVAK